VKEAYINPDWRAILELNGLADFEALWNRNVDLWHEAPNLRRGGWSGVVKTALKTPDGGVAWVFIKRQENHAYRALRHGCRLAATFEREFFNIQRFRRWGIPTLEPVFFQQQWVDGKLRAILATVSLEGYVDLDHPGLRPVFLSPVRREALFRAVADAVGAMHVRRLQHGSLYAKHILVKEDNEGRFDARLIDLEKVRSRLTMRGAQVRDFYAFLRRLSNWSPKHLLGLFKAYQGEWALSPYSKALLRSIALRANRNKGHAP
jgi:hypothetical protein